MKKETITNIPVTEKNLRAEIWAWENVDVLLDTPKGPFVAKKSSILNAFLEEFEKNIQRQEILTKVNTFVSKWASKIRQLDSIFLLVDESRSLMDFLVLLNNRRYNRKIALKVFNLRIAIEDNFKDYNVNFLSIPRFDKDDGEIVSSAFVKIYP